MYTKIGFEEKKLNIAISFLGSGFNIQVTTPSLPGKVKEMVYLENDIGGKNVVPVYLDITIMELQCEHVTLDIQDGHGRYEIDEHSTNAGSKKAGADEKNPEVEKVGMVELNFGSSLL